MKKWGLSFYLLQSNSMREIVLKLKIIVVVLIISVFVVLFKDGGLFNWRLWLDLAWWVRLLYKMDFTEYNKTFSDTGVLSSQKQNVVNIVVKNIDGRVSKLGVSDYSARFLSLNWVDYIEVQIWWLLDVDAAKKLIWKTLETMFRVEYEWDATQEVKDQRQVFAEDLLNTSVKSWFDSLYAYADNLTNGSQWIFYQPRDFTWDSLHKFLGVDEFHTLSWDVYPTIVDWQEGDIKGWYILKYLWEFTWSQTNLSWAVDTWASLDIIKRFETIFITDKPIWQNVVVEWKLLNGERFKMATVDRWPDWEPVVNIYFDEEWAKVFCEATKRALKKPMAIFIWNKLVSAPTIQDQICWWVAMISWWFSWEEAKELAENLNTWAMPIPLSLEQEEKISPKLWENAMMWSLIAWSIGLMMLFVVFVVMYGIRLALITMFTLIWFFVVLLACIKLFGVVLSLSAIWAVLLNVGMWVDANIIIFERIREELAQWKPHLKAVLDWASRSYSAIRDGNMTTWLIAILLVLIGTNMFKWFWTMMIINIIIILTIVVPMVVWLLVVMWEKKKWQSKPETVEIIET